MISKCERTWTCHSQAEILREQFPEMQWIVEDLVPEDSLVLLGGKKKLGKSFMALQMAQAVAEGTPFLNRSTTQGQVLYLCLEDGKRRLNRRLLKQGATDPTLPIFYITGIFPSLDLGGFQELKGLISMTKPILVIIDTLAAAKSGDVEENAAGDMGDLVNDLRNLCQELHATIIVIAHHGKSSYGDAGHDIRGSSAIPAAADINIGLYKSDGGFVLKAEGRDIEEVELRLQFESATCTWSLVGDARDIARGEAELAVLLALQELGEAHAGQMAEVVGKARQTVEPVLKRLVAEGRLSARTVKEGRTLKTVYSIKVEEPPAPPAPSAAWTCEESDGAGGIYNGEPPAPSESGTVIELDFTGAPPLSVSDR